MSALHVRRMSDILAATRKAEVQGGAEPSFWNRRRIVLSIGYLLVFLSGVAIIVAADPNGLILLLAALIGFLFLHRTWAGVVVWAYVLLSGLFALTQGDDLGFYGVLAGLVFGAVALPIRPKRSIARPVAHWQRSPFQMPTAPQPIAASEGSAQPQPASTATPAVAELAKPRLRTIGRIQFVTASGDLSSQILRKPVLGFLWLYLLAREVRKPGDRWSRASAIDEVAHGVKDPRARLRGYLLDLGKLPEPAGQMPQVEDELVGFDLTGVDTDVIQLREVARRVRESNGAIDDDVLRDAQALLIELGDGEFLPGFEDIEKRVTSGRGQAGQAVAEVRAQVDTIRADVAVAVGEALLQRRRASDAAALLDPIVRRAEDRDDVALTLSNALHQLGQHDRAAEVRRRYAVGQEN